MNICYVGLQALEISTDVMLAFKCWRYPLMFANSSISQHGGNFISKWSNQASTSSVHCLWLMALTLASEYTYIGSCCFARFAYRYDQNNAHEMLHFWMKRLSCKIPPQNWWFCVELVRQGHSTSLASGRDSTRPMTVELYHILASISSS